MRAMPPAWPFPVWYLPEGGRIDSVVMDMVPLDGVMWFELCACEGATVDDVASDALEHPFGITAGPDADLWFTGWGRSTIGVRCTMGG